MKSLSLAVSLHSDTVTVCPNRKYQVSESQLKGRELSHARDSMILCRQSDALVHISQLTVCQPDPEHGARQSEDFAGRRQWTIQSAGAPGGMYKGQGRN